MCLITKQTKPVKTRKNKTVYKLVNPGNEKNTTCESFLSPRPFLYEIDVLNQTEINTSTEKAAYDNIVQEKYKLDPRHIDDYNKKLKTITVLGEGFHAALEAGRLSTYGNKIIAEFLIPKGSLVYTDATGLIISNQIIFKKII